MRSGASFSRRVAAADRERVQPAAPEPSLAQRLPIELLDHILKYTSPRRYLKCNTKTREVRYFQKKTQALAFGAVCRQWRLAALPLLYGVVEIRDGRSLPILHELFDGLNAHGASRYVKELYVLCPVTNNFRFDHLTAILEHCTELRHLHCSHKLLRRWESQGHKFLPFDLQGCTIQDASFKLMSRHLSLLFNPATLRHLHLSGGIVEAAGETLNLVNLERLVLARVNLKADHVSAWFGSCEKMTSLHICGPVDPESEARIRRGDLREAEETLRRLFQGVGKNLVFLRMTEQSDMLLRDSNLRYLPKLVHLSYYLESDLHDCAYVDVEAARYECLNVHALTLPPTLESLRLEWLRSSGLTFFFLRAFQSPTYLPNLKTQPHLRRCRYSYEQRYDEYNDEVHKATAALCDRNLLNGSKITLQYLGVDTVWSRKHNIFTEDFYEGSDAESMDEGDWESESDSGSGSGEED